MNLRNRYDKLTRSYGRWSPLAFKCVLASWIAAAVVLPLVLAGLPFIEFLNDMAAQPKGKTQMTIGRMLQPTVPTDRPAVSGTVPREFEAYAFDYLGNQIADAQFAGRRLLNPVPVTMENLRRGQSRYAILCNTCHGPQAQGNGPVVGASRFPAPPSLNTDQARNYTDGTIFHIITKGTGKMPSYADKLNPADRWKVIAFLRAIQLANNPPGATSQPATTRPGATQP